MIGHLTTDACASTDPVGSVPSGKTQAGWVVPCILGWFIKIKSDQIITAGGLLVAH